ncbi:hypothetical protein [Mycobacterium arosiense]|uniref:hypothetical protein n=1 Tax=Mycobacterium arosiense TaxID=425468 RepID=UPI001472D275|nr:hypothetical protein [Mycobacterium arosiense]
MIPQSSFGFVRFYGPTMVKPLLPGSMVTGNVQADAIGAAKARTTATTILLVRRDIRTLFCVGDDCLMPDGESLRGQPLVAKGFREYWSNGWFTLTGGRG